MMKQYTLLRVFLFILGLSFLMPVQARKNEGELANLVCFVSFLGESDEEGFEMSFADYESLFNNDAAGANSVFNYFREASYGKLLWNTSFYPAAQAGRVVAYEARNERGYYREKSSINEMGYADEVERAAREQALVKEIAAHLSESLPASTVLDADGDGIIDNLCIVLSGRSELSARHMLWPHRSDLALPDEKAIFIQGKKLVGYLMVFDDANGWASLEPIPLNTGVLCHEMSHSLGTYDLYHVNDDLNPVGVWDLMADNQLVPQHMSAYTKFRYCGWLDEIPEISEPGTYTLNPVGGATPERIAYKIKPVGSDEYFVVEYRRRTGTFDASLPESGLLVYRINPAYTGGNVNYNGTSRLDEVYIFRPGGTTKSDGEVYKAAFSAESGRTSFGGSAEVRPFYSDGTEARFALTNISACGETLSFTLEELGHQISLSKEVVTLHGGLGDKMELTVEADVDWQLTNVPEWLSASVLAGEAGKTVLVLETTAENTAAQTREAVLLFTSPTDASLRTELTVKQLSNLILPPSDVSATLVDGKVQLAWTAPQEGAMLLADGFEDTSNPNGWQVKNAGDRGWHWYAADKYYPAMTGSYSFYMKSAWDDLHQDERLTSPVFAYGRTLTFYSRSIAPGKNLTTQFYYVEVSTDGGVTWTPVYDLMRDCDVVNKFTKITIDLSAYQSATMCVSFHAYDTNDLGLSYWWQIDDVTIDAAATESHITGYAIYRDGAKIGESSTCSYTDEQPLPGTHSYTVRAVGDFGETSDSEPVSVDVAPTGILSAEADAAQAVRVLLDGDVLHVSASAPLQSVQVFTVAGHCQFKANVCGSACTLNVGGWNTGLYVVKCVTSDARRPVVRKVIVR